MKKLIIDRTLWFRGNGSAMSKLRLMDGKMCCLGFYALACDYSVEEITNKLYFGGVAGDINVNTEEYIPAKGESAWLNARSCGPLFIYRDFWMGEKVYASLANINDDMDLTDQVREARIAKIFKQNGVQIEFIN